MSYSYTLSITCDVCGKEALMGSVDSDLRITWYRTILHKRGWTYIKNYGTQETKDLCPDCSKEKENEYVEK